MDGLTVNGGNTVVLPRDNRVTTASDFSRIMRTGVRSGRQYFMLFAQRADSSTNVERVGFVVSKSVGNAVVRNRVKRRLRHLTAEFFEQRGRQREHNGPLVCDFVIRAFPAAAEANYLDLKTELGAALRSVEQRLCAQ